MVYEINEIYEINNAKSNISEGHKCTLINKSNTTANNNKHEKKTCMRMHIYKR